METEGIELPSSFAAIRLLILTGCRLGEIMTLQWKYVDIPGKALRLPDSKNAVDRSAEHQCTYCSSDITVNDLQLSNQLLPL